MSEMGWMAKTAGAACLRTSGGLVLGSPKGVPVDDEVLLVITLLVWNLNAK